MTNVERRTQPRMHVVILAQGNQTRMGDLGMPKQLLGLPKCADTPILERTLVQISRLNSEAIVTVVCGAWIRGFVQNNIRSDIYPIRVLRTVELADPGNSSLKGIQRYLDQQLYYNPLVLEHRGTLPGPHDVDNPTQIPKAFPEQVVILLGDVVYSWACLRAIFASSRWHGHFVGTSNLSPSAGELWGISFEEIVARTMRVTLGDALQRHPPFEGTYQPGQLRRWLWAYGEFVQQTLGSPWFVAIDDYTKDIDLPSDLDLLLPLSVAAAYDDDKEGIAW